MIKKHHGTSMEVQWLKIHLPMQGVWVRSLVRKQDPIFFLGKKQNIEQKQYCNKFNKAFKNVPHLIKKKNFKKYFKKNSVEASDGKVLVVRYWAIPTVNYWAYVTAGSHWKERF